MDTNILENYLARYINRIAISPSRLTYVKETKEVHILYNDYKNQNAGEIAPKLIKNLKPLIAIQQILLHNLPTYFQKSRSYGLHNASNILKSRIPKQLKRNGKTIRTVLEIITQLLKLEKLNCQICGHTDFFEIDLIPSNNYIKNFLLHSSSKSPPINVTYTPYYWSVINTNCEITLPYSLTLHSNFVYTS